MSVPAGGEGWDQSWGAGSVSFASPEFAHPPCLSKTPACCTLCLPARLPARRADMETCGWGAGMAATWPSSRSTPPSSSVEVRVGVGGWGCCFGIGGDCVEAASQMLRGQPSMPGLHAPQNLHCIALKSPCPAALLPCCPAPLLPCHRRHERGQPQRHCGPDQGGRPAGQHEAPKYRACALRLLWWLLLAQNRPVWPSFE